MQWNWFEPRRVLRLEKRRKQAEAGGGGKVGFGVDVLGKGNDAFSLGSRRASVVSLHSPSNDSAPNTPRGAMTPRGGETPRGGLTPRGGSTPRGSARRMRASSDGLTTPRLNTPRSHLSTPRLGSDGLNTPRAGGSKEKKKKKKETRRADAPRAPQVHPMKNQIQGPLVLQESIKRLKMMMMVRTLEKLHRVRWKQYRADVVDVKAQLKKQVDHRDTVAEARQLLLNLPIAKFVAERDIQQKLEKAVGPPPLRSPWLPEKELCTLIDETLQMHYTEKPAEKKSKGDMARRSSASPPGDARPGGLARQSSGRQSLPGSPSDDKPTRVLSRRPSLSMGSGSGLGSRASSGVDPLGSARDDLDSPSRSRRGSVLPGTGAPGPPANPPMLARRNSMSLGTEIDPTALGLPPRPVRRGSFSMNPGDDPLHPHALRRGSISSDMSSFIRRASFGELLPFMCAADETSSPTSPGVDRQASQLSAASAESPVSPLPLASL